MVFLSEVIWVLTKSFENSTDYNDIVISPSKVNYNPKRDIQWLRLEGHGDKMGQRRNWKKVRKQVSVSSSVLYMKLSSYHVTENWIDYSRLQSFLRTWVPKCKQDNSTSYNIRRQLILCGVTMRAYGTNHWQKIIIKGLIKYKSQQISEALSIVYHYYPALPVSFGVETPFFYSIH